MPLPPSDDNIKIRLVDFDDTVLHETTTPPRLGTYPPLIMWEEDVYRATVIVPDSIRSSEPTVVYRKVRIPRVV